MATSSSNGGESSGSGTKIALRTEDEQQAAAREREERERAEAEKEASDRREARRKSLANRRVSFAAEATLHTFHEIEYMQDSTTSTESTRRASSVTSQSPAPQNHGYAGSDASDPPSSPMRMADDAAEPSANQQDPSQKGRRRSSAIPPLNFNNPEDDTLGSALYSSDSEQADGVAEIQGEEYSGSDSEVEDGTVMTVDADEMTSASMASVRSVSTASESTSLDENLRLAAQRAATQQLEDDGNDDNDDDDEGEVIPALLGWGKNNKPSQAPQQHNDPSNRPGDDPPQSPANQDEDGTQMEMDMEMDTDMNMDMDMTNAVGRIIQPQNVSPQQSQDEEMSMDVTQALGGIISKEKPSNRRRSVFGKKSVAGKRETLSFGEETMELTTAMGAVHSSRASDASQFDLDGNEDMSMELTTAIGGLVSNPDTKSTRDQGRRRTLTAKGKQPDNDDATMDMTVGVGRILPVEDDNDEGGDVTMGMEMTLPLGNIIKPAANSDARTVAKQIMEQEANQPDTPVAMESRAKPLVDKSTAKSAAKSAAKPAAKPEAKPATNHNGREASPSLEAFRGKGLRRTPTRSTLSLIHI